MGWFGRRARRAAPQRVVVGCVGGALVAAAILVTPAAATASVAAVPSVGESQEIAGLIVAYEPGVEPTEAPGVATGSSEVTEPGLVPGDAIGFGLRTVGLTEPVSAQAADEIAAELESSPKVSWAEPDHVLSLDPVSAFGGSPKPVGTSPSTAPVKGDPGAVGEPGKPSPPGQVDADTTQTSPPWGLDRIDQRALPLNSSYGYETTGAGVTAYIVDSGIRSTHNELAGRVSSGFTAIADGNGTNDCNGHGTHVSGTVGGSTYGVAKQVTLVPVRVLNCQGSGSDSTVISGLNFVVSNHSAGVPAVANLSLGGPPSTALDNAVNATVNDGVTVVVSSGNSGDQACNYSPARVPAAITVNASTIVDDDASFSNYGSCSDLYAPGVDVVSASSTSDTATATLSGTSMASPHVAGVAARLLQSSPSMTPAQVWTAIDGSTTSVDFGLGACCGDPNKLLYAAGPPPPSAPANDAFASGQVVTGPSGSVNGSTVSATKETGEPNHAANAGGASVWYRWTAPSNGTVVLNTFGSGFDTLLAAYTGGTVAALTAVASNDDAGGGLQSEITFAVATGSTYKIAVDGYNAATGSTTLTRSFTALPPDGTTRRAPTGVFETAAGPRRAPTGVFATADNGAATVYFAPSVADPGTPGTSYSVVASPGGATAAGTTSPITVTGLTNGTQYTFAVTATDFVGQGPAAGVSNAVVPAASSGSQRASGPSRVPASPRHERDGLPWTVALLAALVLFGLLLVTRMGRGALRRVDRGR